MSVDSVMTEFNNVIRKNYELEIFDIVIPDADEETGTVPAYFDPETLIEDDICKTIDTAKTQSTGHSCISLMIWKFQMANTKIF